MAELDTKPVLTLKGENPLRLDVSQLFIDPGASAIDKEDGDISDNITIVSSVQSQLVGEYDVVYTIEDSKNNKVSKTRKVIYTNKFNEKPFLEILGANPLLLELGKTFIEPGITARDKEDGDISDKIVVLENNIDNSTVGEYEIKYEITDSGGLSTVATRKVVVVQDDKPVIILRGESIIYLNLGELYFEQGASANDPQDGDISADITINSSLVDTSKIGTYNVIYEVVDTHGNSSQVIRKVIIGDIPKGTLVGVDSNVSGKHIGAGVGGSMFAIAIHPTDSSNILFSGDMGLVYHTTNNGSSWKIIPGLYQIRFIEFDTKNPNIVWAGGESGLYKSIDGGKNWKYSFNVPSYEASLGAVSIDPSNSNIIYVAEGFISRIKISWVRGKVWKSINGGESWTEVTRPGGKLGVDTIYNRNYTTIVVDPNSSYDAEKGHSRVYLVGRDGIFKTEDAGESWQDITFFTNGQGSDMVLINKNGKSILFFSVIPVKGLSTKGVYRSDDNGESWQANNVGLSSIVSRLEARNRNLSNSSLFSLMLSSSAADPSRLYVGSWQGIATSNNMGESWVQNTPAETPYIKHADGKFIPIPSKRRINHSESFLGGIDNFMRIKSSNSNPDFVIFSDNEDIHVSENAGATWKSWSFDYTESFGDPDAVIPILAEGEVKNRYTHKIKSRGIQGTVNTAVAVDPFNPNIYYATYMDVGMQISRDYGESWEHPTNGLPARGHAWSILVDPSVEGKLWIGALEKGGIYTSNDFGVSWEEMSVGNTGSGAIRDMVLDPESSIESRIIYAATENKGIYKSLDGGQSWNNILEKSGTLDIKMDVSDNKILYVATQEGTYKSIDAGENWTKIGSLELGKTYNISIGTDNDIFVIANVPGKPSYWANRKLWKSQDGGNSFTDITPRFMNIVGAVAVDPKNSNHIYIANFNRKQNELSNKMIMAHSFDGGNTWKQIAKDTAFAMGTDIYINPKNNNQVFFVTRFSLIEIGDI